MRWIEPFEDNMPDSLNMPVTDENFVRFVDDNPPSGQDDLRPRSAPRSNPMSAIESPTATLHSSAAAIQLFFPADRKQSSTNGKMTLQGVKLITLVISSSALVVWLFLMLTVVAESGSVLQIAAITMIPFLAHVASVCLTAFSISHEFSAGQEPQASHSSI